MRVDIKVKEDLEKAEEAKTEEPAEEKNED